MIVKSELNISGKELKELLMYIENFISYLDYMSRKDDVYHHNYEVHTKKTEN